MNAVQEMLRILELPDKSPLLPRPASLDDGKSNDLTAIPDLKSYDRICVGFSGGKDSIACVLHLLELGVPPEKIELHHNLVDGREGSRLFDWPVTEAYCAAYAHAFGMTLFMSWRQGGLEREMLRNGERTAPVAFESEDGTIKVTGGDGGKEGTRLRFPQLSASLQTRYCSAYGKIDVFSRVLTNEPRFVSSRTLVVTGERAEESASRARYKVFEPHRSDNRTGKSKRHIDVWRAVHGWSEVEVWAIMERHRINPHPAYWLGWGRLSCRNCVFGSASQWATIRAHMPHAFIPVATYEKQFGVTIHRTKTVDQLADGGIPYNCDPDMLKLAESAEYTAPIIVSKWRLPPGAFKETAGPT